MAALVTVAGTFHLPSDTPAGAGRLTFQLVPGDVPDTAADVVIAGLPVVVPIAADGTWTVDLRSTDDPDLLERVDGDLVYRVNRTIGSRHDSWLVTIPGPGPVDWSDLTPVAQASATVRPVPGPAGLANIVAVPYSDWPPTDPVADVLYLRLAPA